MNAQYKRNEASIEYNGCALRCLSNRIMYKCIKCIYAEMNILCQRLVYTYISYPLRIIQAIISYEHLDMQQPETCMARDINIIIGRSRAAR
jgi:hypothetical protein